MKKRFEDVFLNKLFSDADDVTVFLVNGVKLSGVINWADDNSISLTRDGISQLIFKHAIATVMPQDAFSISKLMMVE